MAKDGDVQYDEAETKRRVEAALKAAFNTPPKPLKEKREASKPASRPSGQKRDKRG